MKGFMDFIREQGVVGLAVGFILGGSVSKLVSSLVKDLIDPLLGLALSSVGSLTSMKVMLPGSAPGVENALLVGNFLSVLIDFFVVAAVVYFGVKWLKLDKLDKKKA